MISCYNDFDSFDVSTVDIHRKCDNADDRLGAPGVVKRSGVIREGRFGSKVGQIGPQMGQIRGFFRSDFSAFGVGAHLEPI